MGSEMCIRDSIQPDHGSGKSALSNEDDSIAFSKVGFLNEGVQGISEIFRVGFLILWDFLPVFDEGES